MEREITPVAKKIVTYLSQGGREIEHSLDFLPRKSEISF